MTDATKTNFVNHDFQAELAALQGDNIDSGKVVTLKAPQSVDERRGADKTIDEEQLFGANVLTGRIPELTQNFILQKSKEDKIVELGSIAQEVYTTKRVSRNQIIAFESIARELIPATKDEIAAEDRKIIVSDHEVNMFTEEPSATEVKTVIDGSQTTIDRVVSDVRNSALDLYKSLVETAKSDAVERNEKIYKSISVFNKAVSSFVKETKADALENTQIRFKRDLMWGDLMAVNLTNLKFHADQGLYAENVTAGFDGTYAETFIKELNEFLTKSNNAIVVLNNFVNGKPAIVRCAEEERNECTKYYFTVGQVFQAFGSEKFFNFYTHLLSTYDAQIEAAKTVSETLNGETDINKLITISSSLNNIHKTLMDINANLAVLNAVEYMVICFLAKFK